MTLRNVLVAPVVLLVRAPLVLLGKLFSTIGHAFIAVGYEVPGFDR